jgi:DNA-binding MarR family transcriptional regulator
MGNSKKSVFTRSLMYVRYLACLQALETPKSKTLDSTEHQLLDYLMLQTNQEHIVLVGDLLALAHLGSPATLHQRVKHLERMGYISLSSKAHDARKKEVRPTSQTLHYYERLSACMQEAVSS